MILIRGGGDLASGVALRLHRAKYRVLITEISEPLAVRRAVAFAEAVYQRTWEVEGVIASRVEEEALMEEVWRKGQIPLLIDPAAEVRKRRPPTALVDGRMLKKRPELGMDAAPIVIGLGPGFNAGVDCHAVIETNRGHAMGRVYWQGTAEANTGIPEPIAGYDADRVIRAPTGGVLNNGKAIGTMLSQGEVIAMVGETSVTAAFDGVLRGLLHDDVDVYQDQKIGDLDPRGEPSYCFQVSDKALAVAGGVLEALLSQGVLPLTE